MTTTTQRGRPRAFDRDVALDQAIRLFWRKGYAATSVRDLSQELGIGQPSLYHAFGDKRALFEEAVATYGRTYGGFIGAAVAEEPTAALALRRLLSEAPAVYTRRGLPTGCLISCGEVGTDDEQVHADMVRVRGRSTALLRDRIATDVAAGHLPSDTDADGLAGFVMGVLTGLVLRARDGASRHELERIAAVAATALPS